MRCEWCCHSHPAEWYGWTIYDVAAWMCTQQRDRIGVRDKDGKFEVVPAAERLAALHKTGGAA